MRQEIRPRTDRTLRTATVVNVHGDTIDVQVGGSPKLLRGLPVIGGTEGVRASSSVVLREQDGQLYAYSTKSRRGARRVEITGGGGGGSGGMTPHTMDYHTDAKPWHAGLTGSDLHSPKDHTIESHTNPASWHAGLAGDDLHDPKTHNMGDHGDPLLWHGSITDTQYIHDPKLHASRHASGAADPLSHDDLAGVGANEHLDWTVDQDPNDIAGANIVKAAITQYSYTYADLGLTAYEAEDAQDAVGTILADSGSIDFTYTDATPEITAVVLPSGVDHDSLSNYVADEHVAHSGVSVSAGGILSGGGAIDASCTISLAHGDVDHDQTLNFVASEHIDWTQDQGATNINYANIVMTSDATVDPNTLLRANASGELTLDNLYVEGMLRTNLVRPKSNSSYDLGTSSYLYRKLWVSEIDTLRFVENSIQVAGGFWMIPHGSGTLTADVGTGDSTIDFGQSMTVGDFVLFSGNGNTEYVEVGSLVSGTTYNVTRDLDATGADAWSAGHAYVVLGQSGDGRVEFDAQTGGPRISVKTQGATWDSETEVIRLGDLNGWGPYSSTAYGVGFGDYSGGDYLKWDATNGLVISGEINATEGDIGGWMIDNVQIRSGPQGTDIILESGDGGATPGLYINGMTWTSGGIQLQYYNDSVGRFYAGDGADQYVKFDGTDFTFKNPMAALHSSSLYLGDASEEHIYIDGLMLSMKNGPTVYAYLWNSTLALGDTTNAHSIYTPTEMTFYDQNDNAIAVYGDTITLGQTSNPYITLTSTGLNVFDHEGTQTAFYGDGLWIGESSSGARMEYDGTMGLSLFDSTNTRMLRFGPSNSYIAGVLNIDTAGEIRQGTGTLGTDYTGLRIWHDSDIGRIAGYNSDSMEWYAGTDGRFYVGGGAVTLDDTGINITAGTADVNKIKWAYSGTDISDLYVQHGSGGDVLGHWWVYNPDSSTNYSDLYMIAKGYNVGTGAALRLRSRTDSSDEWAGLILATQIKFRVYPDYTEIKDDARIGKGLYVGGTGTDPRGTIETQAGHGQPGTFTGEANYTGGGYEGLSDNFGDAPGHGGYYSSSFGEGGVAGAIFQGGDAYDTYAGGGVGVYAKGGDGSDYGAAGAGLYAEPGSDTLGSSYKSTGYESPAIFARGRVFATGYVGIGDVDWVTESAEVPQAELDVRGDIACTNIDVESELRVDGATYTDYRVRITTPDYDTSYADIQFKNPSNDHEWIISYRANVPTESYKRNSLLISFFDDASQSWKMNSRFRPGVGLEVNGLLGRDGLLHRYRTASLEASTSYASIQFGTSSRTDTAHYTMKNGVISSTQIQVNDTGWYWICFEGTSQVTSGTGRDMVEYQMQESTDGGSSWSNLQAAYACSYARTANRGRSTASITKIEHLNEGDRIRVRFRKKESGNTTYIMGHGVRITMQYVDF